MCNLVLLLVHSPGRMDGSVLSRGRNRQCESVQSIFRTIQHSSQLQAVQPKQRIRAEQNREECHVNTHSILAVMHSVGWHGIVVI